MNSLISGHTVHAKNMTSQKNDTENEIKIIKKEWHSNQIDRKS